MADGVLAMNQDATRKFVHLLALGFAAIPVGLAHCARSPQEPTSATS